MRQAEPALRGLLSPRLSKQLLQLQAAIVRVPEERIVRRVLQEPSDEVRHPRQRLTERSVDPHAVALLGQELRLIVGHAVEHLDLPGRLRNLEILRYRDAVRDAAEVVAAERGADPLVIFEQDA